MKKLLITALALFSISSFAQTFQPEIGLNYSGGLTYGMDAELFSGKFGILFTPRQAGKYHDKDSFISSVELAGNFYYDFYPKHQFKKYTYYLAKIQVAKKIVEWWNVVAFGGYVDTFNGKHLMNYYAGNYKNKLAYGGGFQTFDDHVVGEILFQELGGYPNLSVGITYKFRAVKFKKSK